MQGGRGEEKYGILDQVRIKQLNSNHILLNIETAGQVQGQGEKFNEEIWDPWNMNDISPQLVHLQVWRKKTKLCHFSLALDTLEIEQQNIELNCKVDV